MHILKIEYKLFYGFHHNELLEKELKCIHPHDEKYKMRSFRQF